MAKLAKRQSEWRRHAWLRLEASLEMRIQLELVEQRQAHTNASAHGERMQPNPDVIAHYTALAQEHVENEAVTRATLDFVRRHIRK